MNEEKTADLNRSQVSELRREAERCLDAEQSLPVQGMPEAEVRALVQELQVHQIELEMQNEELLRSQGGLHEVSDKFQDLFDFAPVGYFLWDEQERILEINLAAAALLGFDRSALVSGRLGRYVAAPSLARFAEFCGDMLRTDDQQTCEIDCLRSVSMPWTCAGPTSRRGGWSSVWT